MRARPRDNRLARVLHWLAAPLARGVDLIMLLISPVGKRLILPPASHYLRFVPSLPRFTRFRTNPRRGPWSVRLPPIPEALRTVPGIWRDPEAEEAEFARKPLRSFFFEYSEIARWQFQEIWRGLFPTFPRLERAMNACHKTAGVEPRPPAVGLDAKELTRELKEYTAGIGLSAIGIAEYDEKYTFKEFEGVDKGDRVIVCILEQHHGATQSIPSIRAQHATMSTYAELMRLATRLAKFLHEKGYRAHAHDFEGQAVVIHYGVAAGLGQLGLNGQLLTPAAGSRCRIVLVTTDAPLVPDQPVDYGMHKICDACRACVRRCPAKALSANRKVYRGIKKAKLNTARCVPVMNVAHDCGICMKVCPVQRYGGAAVLKEYERTGKILGKETDELEGYDWPRDGRHYGPGERPRLDDEFFQPPAVKDLPEWKALRLSAKQSTR